MCMDYLDQIRPWGGSANGITHLIPCHPIKHASHSLSWLLTLILWTYKLSLTLSKTWLSFLWQHYLCCVYPLPMRFTLASAPALLRWQDSIGKRSALRLACQEADGVLYCFIAVYTKPSWDVFFNFLWLQFSAGVWYVTEKFGTKGTCLTYQFKTDNLGFKSVEQVKSAAHGVMNFVMILTKTLCLD